MIKFLRVLYFVVLISAIVGSFFFLELVRIWGPIIAVIFVIIMFSAACPRCDRLVLLYMDRFRMKNWFPSKCPHCGFKWGTAILKEEK